MATYATYCLTVTTVKLSLLVTYRRIFDTAAFKQRTLLVGIACVVWFIVTLFTGVFQCRPFSAAFDPKTLFTYHCIDLQSYYWGTCAANMVLDFVVLLLPLYMVWGLALPKRQKLAVSGIFMLGFM